MQIQEAGDVRPVLRLAQILLMYDGVHGGVVALGAGKIRQLADQIGKALAGERRHTVIGVAVCLRAVAFCTVSIEQLCPALLVDVVLQRLLVQLIDMFIGALLCADDSGLGAGREQQSCCRPPKNLRYLQFVPCHIH